MGRFIKFGGKLARAAQVEREAGAILWIAPVLLLILTATLVFGFRHANAINDEAALKTERSLAANYFERAGGFSISQQKVQLTWDDAFRAAAYDVDSKWADTYLGEFLSSNFQYDRLYLVDPKGSAKWAWQGDHRTGTSEFAGIALQVSQELARIDANGSVFGKIAGYRRIRDTSWPIDDKGRPLTRWSVSLVRFDGQPAIMTLASILPDTNYALLDRKPNHLVSLRFLDQRFLDNLGKTMLFDGPTIRAKPSGLVHTNALPLRARDGTILGWLEWRTVPGSETAREHMQPLFAAYLCILIALIVAGGSLIRALVAAMRNLRRREADAIYEARHDPMSGLPNRGHFSDLLERELAKLSEDRETAIGVALFDIDNFKLINDTMGHKIGDDLVLQVAARCREHFPESDLLARFGGDEFVLMRRVKKGPGEVSRLGRELMAVFAEPFDIDGRTIVVTASAGISWAPEQGTCPDRLLSNADIALHRAKQRGRARWRGFNETMEQAVRRRHELEVELRKAIKADQLSVVYQPIIDIGSGEIEGVEALLRWEHPELGKISPAVFVPVAEQAGLMPMLGWWTLERIFEDRIDWPGLNLSINLSPAQLASARFVEELSRLAARSDLNPEKITFEVTEGLLLERGKGMFAVLGQLQGLGFKIALDDFGTGYSSLSYLRAFRFDRLKIDRAFVQNIENDPDAQAILRTISALGRTLNARTVAEGVESLIQHEMVRAAGCDLIQGHFYWPAMTAQRLREVLSLSKTPEVLRQVG